MSEQSVPPPIETEHESVLLDHCAKVYAAMQERASQTPQGLIYTGSLVSMFNELEGLGQPYYTVVTRKLKAMDCIRQIQRGGGPKPSRWMLLQAPTKELFDLPGSYRERVSTSQGTKAMTSQQIRDLNIRLGRLEQWARNQGYR